MIKITTRDVVEVRFFFFFFFGLDFEGGYAITQADASFRMREVVASRAQALF